MYCLMSARSRKAKSIASVTLLVVKIKTFGKLLIWSSCVKSALTTLIESLGSVPFALDLRTWANDSTSSTKIHIRAVGHSRRSLNSWKSFVTNLPL